jgi:hypothetical protein
MRITLRQPGEMNYHSISPYHLLCGAGDGNSAIRRGLWNALLNKERKN